MEDKKQELEDFVEWLRNCGEDAFYVFDETNEAIQKYLMWKEDE